MSIDYTIKLAVGYVIPEEELTRVFGRKTEGRTHLEDRFDPKTGKKIDPIEVVDEFEYTTLYYRGVEFEDSTYELAEKIAKDIEVETGCCAIPYGNNMSGETSVVFGPDLRSMSSMYDDNELESGHVTCSGGVPFSLLIECGSALGVIRKALRDIGLNPGEPVVVPAWWVS